jgi:hypothetical protein
MSVFDSADMHISERANSASEAPIVISQDGARQAPQDAGCSIFSDSELRARSSRTQPLSLISLCSMRQAEICNCLSEARSHEPGSKAAMGQRIVP